MQAYTGGKMTMLGLDLAEVSGPLKQSICGGADVGRF
jgi:hypothetical protein